MFIIIIIIIIIIFIFIIVNASRNFSVFVSSVGIIIISFLAEIIVEIAHDPDYFTLSWITIKIAIVAYRLGVNNFLIFSYGLIISY